MTVARKSPVPALFAALAAFVVAAVPRPAHALFFGMPGGTVEDKTFHVGGGFGVSQRTVLDDGDGTYRSISGISFLGKMGYTPWSWLDVSLNGGVASLSRSGADPERTRKADEDALNNVAGAKRTVDYSGFLSPAVGATVRFNLLRKTKAELDVSVLATGQAVFGDGVLSEPDAKKALDSSVADDTSGPAKLTQYEGSAGLIVSRKTDNMVPYLGAYWAYLRYQLEGRKVEEDWKRIGIFVGLDYYVTPVVFFGLELHNFDQDAAFGSVGAEF